MIKTAWLNLVGSHICPKRIKNVTWILWIRELLVFVYIMPWTRWPDASVFNFLMHVLLFPRYLSSVSQPLCPVWGEHQAVVCSESHDHGWWQDITPAPLPDEVWAPAWLLPAGGGWQLAWRPESLSKKICSHFVIGKFYICLVWERTSSVFGMQFRMNLITLLCHIVEEKSLWCRGYFEKN